MSKSLGNIVTVHEIVEKYHPDVLRMLVPVSLLAETPLGVFVNPALNINTLPELIAAMRAGQHADIECNTGVVARLQIKHGIADVDHTAHIGNAGRFHAMKNHVRRGTPLLHLITTDHGVNHTLAPAQRIEEQMCRLPVKPGVECNAHTALPQRIDHFARARHGFDGAVKAPGQRHPGAA